LINTKIALVPSLALSQCLARLLGRTAKGQKNKSTQEDKQNHFTDKKISLFHHFFPFRNLKKADYSPLIITFVPVCRYIPYLSSTKPTAIY